MHMTMKSVVAAVILAVAMPASPATTIVSVQGKNNPFLAGRPDGTTCCGGDAAPGASPTLVSLANFNLFKSFTISAVGGFSNTGGTPDLSADGSGSRTMSAGILGISGPASIRNNALVGVFLNDNVPSGSAPSVRNDGISFATLAPGLRQIFWIGDGLTGTGTGSAQKFFVPAGATRLFLGASEGTNWTNNTGTSTVTITYAAVPEPASWAMMIGGFGLIGGAMRRRPATHVAKA